MNIIKKHKFSVPLAITFAAVALPGIIFAEDVANVSALIKYLISLIDLVIPLIFGIALLAFLWGVFKYVVASDVKSKADGRTFIIYGIIGLAVMLSVWGLVYFVKDSFFQSAQTPLQAPLGQ